jgi:hypothetical protein
VRQHWRDLSEAAEPQALHFLKFNWIDYPEPATPLVFLVFADGASRPVAVVKAARVASGDALIEREFSQLEVAHAILPETLRHVVPVPIRALQVNGRRCFLASAVPGVTELVHTWGARAAAHRQRRMAAALQWSRALGARTAGEPVTLCEWLGVAGVADLQNALSVRGWTDSELRHLEPRLVEMCDAAWPASFVHGDFFPGNLMYEGEALSGVVDWGGSFRRAPVFVDPLTYELSFSLHALHQGRLPGADERDGAHALEPIASCRRDLHRAGVDLSLGSDARLALLVAGSAAIGPAWLVRSDPASRFDTLLRIECGLLRP